MRLPACLPATGQRLSQQRGRAAPASAVGLGRGPATKHPKPSQSEARRKAGRLSWEFHLCCWKISFDITRYLASVRYFSFANVLPHVCHKHRIVMFCLVFCLKFGKPSNRSISYRLAQADHEQIDIVAGHLFRFEPTVYYSIVNCYIHIPYFSI